MLHGRAGAAMRTRPLADLRGWEALAHGVFAIALTLLVLDIRVPDAASIHSGSELVDALIAEMPRYVAYVLGFVVLGLLFLMVVATIPFPTALLAEYMGRGGGQEQVALAVFVGWQLVLALAANVQVHYSARRGLLRPDLPASSLRPWFVVAGAGVVIWAVALLAVFFVSGTVALALIATILVIFAFEMPVRTGPEREETAGHAGRTA